MSPSTRINSPWRRWGAGRAIRPCLRRGAAVAIAVAAATASAAAQSATETGFVDVTFTGYPQTAVTDHTRAIVRAIVRWDPELKGTNWRVNASFEAQTDTHDQTAVEATYWDRSPRRPAFDIRRLSASWVHGPLTLVAGKQFIAWGKTDVVVPTDHVAPKDYVDLMDPEPLAVTAVRATVAGPSDSLDVVFAPRLTPSRAPLLDQRWVNPPLLAFGRPLIDAGGDIPDDPQVGVRWNHLGRHVEDSLSFFQGNDTLPSFSTAASATPAVVDVTRTYPTLTSVGGDLAVPLPWMTIKGEAGWYGSSTAAARTFLLYVVQAERPWREWLFIGGYVGEQVERAGTLVRFDPDEALARAFTGRVAYTIDTNRSFVFEAAARQNGDAFVGRAEYSQTVGSHMRVTAGLRVIRGTPDDLVGQYRRNSAATLSWRYSF
jgi:hypothetical protein